MDGEGLEKLNPTHKLFRNLKILDFTLIKNYSKKWEMEPRKWLQQKGRLFLKKKKSAGTGKLKELLESLISTVLNNFFGNLAKTLLTKLPSPPEKYDLESAINCSVLKLQMIFVWIILQKIIS